MRVLECGLFENLHDEDDDEDAAQTEATCGSPVIVWSVIALWLVRASLASRRVGVAPTYVDASGPPSLSLSLPLPRYLCPGLPTCIFRGKPCVLSFSRSLSSSDLAFSIGCGHHRQWVKHSCSLTELLPFVSLALRDALSSRVSFARLSSASLPTPTPSIGALSIFLADALLPAAGPALLPSCTDEEAMNEKPLPLRVSSDSEDVAVAAAMPRPAEPQHDNLCYRCYNVRYTFCEEPACQSRCLGSMR